MKQTKLWLATIAALLCSIAASAYDFKVDGIYYNITSETDLTVEVTYKSVDYNSGFPTGVHYSGRVLLPPTVTYNGVAYSVTSIGDYAFYECRSLTAITIPEGVTSIGVSAFYGCSSLTAMVVAEGNKVYDSRGDCNAIIETSSNTLIQGCSTTIIPEGVTSIGNNAFRGCSSLTAITLPEGVTSIGDYAFVGCSNLDLVNIPSSVEVIDETAFNFCENLRVILIDDDNLTYYSGGSIGVIERKTKTLLIGTTRGDIDFLNIEHLGNFAFAGRNIKEVDIPNGVISLGSHTFVGSSIRSIKIPSSLKYVGGYTFDSGFDRCENLSAVYIEDLKAWFEIDFEYKYCAPLFQAHNLYLNNELLEVISIPEGVTTLKGYALAGWNGKEVIIPEGLMEIGGRVFRSCEDLAAITCYAVNPPKCTEWTFEDIDKSIPVYVPAGSVDAYKAAEGWSAFTNIQPILNVIASGTCGDNLTWKLFDGGKLVIEGIGEMYDYPWEGAPWYEYREMINMVTLPEGVTSIGGLVFSNCSNLTAITIPENVTSIGDEAFTGCSSLTAIAIPKGVMSVGDHPFKYCSNLVSIIVEEGNVVYDSRNGCNAIIETSSNTLIQGCSETIIPESVTSIGDCAFEGCTNLTSIILPEILMSIGDWAFKSCDSLTSITIPESMMSIGDEAFANCSSLTSIIIPESVTSIGTYAFSGCDELSAVYISSLEAWCNIDFGGDYANPLYSAHDLYLNEQLVTECVFPDAQTVIKDYTFDGCANLTSVTLPEGITEIGYSTFSWCTGLTAINIPEGVTGIGNYAFCGCSGLTSITCNVATPPTIGGSNTFYGVDRSIPVYVPEGSVEAYKAAAFWSEFTNIHITYLSQSHSYLKNIGSGKFLTAANNWGMYASLGERGLDVTISELPNGKYTIETRIRNDETGGRYLGSNLYMDMNADDSEWIITELSNGYYTLSLDGEHYIGYDGKSSLITNTSTDSTDVNVQWKFLTKDDLIAEMENARYTAPVDATFFISGANFSRSDQRNALWQGGPVFGGYNREEGSNFCAEKWSVDAFDVYQQLSGLPNGLYELRAQGYYRVGGVENNSETSELAASQHRDGTESLNAILYANEKEVTLMSIMEGAQQEDIYAGNGDFANTSSGYIPYLMPGASDMFSKGLYQNSLFVEVSDGTLRVGVKKEVGEVNDWTCFDNFELYYYGPVATISDAQTSFSQADNKEYASITYTRNFKNTNWQALYVPFEIPVTEEFLEEFEVSYIYNTRQYDRDDDGVKDETIIEAFKMTSGTLEANYPYLIRAKVAGEKSIVVTNTTLYATEENSIDCSSVFETYTFTGTYSCMSSVLLPQDEGYYALSGGEWRPVADGTSLGAFRFYLKIDSRNGGNNNAANTRSIRMRFVGEDEDGETTGLDNLGSTDKRSSLAEGKSYGQQTTVIYDLQGRRVDNPAKGVYIVNGKKVLVR